MLAKPQRLDSLTGIRSAAVLLVFGFHSLSYAQHGELDIFGAGMVGVSLFYILSGFVMSWTARVNDTAKEFYQRRFARIYPSFIAAWLLSLGLLVVSGSFAFTDLTPPTLLQSWFPFRDIYFAGSAVFWSLSCEAFFYLMFPLLHRWIRDMTARRLIVVGGTAVAVSLGVAVLALPFPENDFTRWALIIFPPLRFMEFIAGAVIGVLFTRGHRLKFPVTPIALLCIAAVWVASVAPYSLSRYAVTLLPFLILIATLATADLSGRRGFFTWRPVVAQGVWSYAFYLLHAMVLSVFFSMLRRWGLYGDDTVGALLWAELVAAFALATFAAWLLHVLVERPLERWLRPKGSRPRLDDDVAAT